MNIKIAICDDKKIICNNLFNILHKISKDISIQIETDCFTSGEELCQEMLHTDYDLIFLDIELPKKNGIEIGKHIRENLHNEVVQIAYISSKQEYTMELFEIRPINFLIKPLDYEKIRKIIDKVLILFEADNRIFRFKKGRKFHKIPISDIFYFCSEGRKIQLVTQNGSFEFYGSLENIYNKVKNSNFLYVHKSFLVNYKYIKNYDYEQVNMIDGTTVPISQSRRKSIRSMFFKIEVSCV